MAECTKAQQNKPTAVALGFFDGLHLGHRAVIDRAVAEAGDTLVPAAFTFSIFSVRGYSFFTSWGMGSFLWKFICIIFYL